MLMPPLTLDSSQVQLELLMFTRLLAASISPASTEAQPPNTVPFPTIADCPTTTQSPITTCNRTANGFDHKLKWMIG
jgi:hypothetical protein